MINPGTTGPAKAFLPGCNATAFAADQCTFRDAGLQIQPPTTSANILSKFTLNLGGDWQSVTSASIFETKAQQAGDFYASTTSSSGGLSLVNVGLPPGSLPNARVFAPITVPANYPGNPYGAPAALVYNFAELGFPYSQFKTDTYRFVQEVNGNAAGWDIGTSAGYMYAITTTDNYGNLEPEALQSALNSGYVLGSSSGASKFAPVDEATASSYLFFGNAHGSRPLAALPGGDLAIALGAEYFEKEAEFNVCSRAVSTILRLTLTMRGRSVRRTRHRGLRRVIGTDLPSAGSEMRRCATITTTSCGRRLEATPKFGINIHADPRA